MKTLTQKLTEKIQEACPELLELSFGCRVFIPGENNHSNRGKRGYGIITHSYVGKDSSWSGYDKKNDGVSVYLQTSDVYRPCISISKNKVETLGHPIQLQHVLRAIEHLRTEQKPLLVSGIANDGRWICGTMVADLANPYGSAWDLTKDLESQSDETKQFLARVLGVE